MPCRSSSFDSRCRQRIRSARTSSRARTRSRAASCSTLGTRTSTISSIRSSRASSNASRASVLIRSAGRPLQLRRRRDHAPHPGRGQLPGQTEPGRPSLVRHRHRPRQLPQPVQDRLRRRHQPPPHHLPGHRVQTTRHDRPRVHVQTNTRTLNEHRGLPQMSALPTGPLPAGNPRQVASEAPARSTGLLIPSRVALMEWTTNTD